MGLKMGPNHTHMWQMVEVDPGAEHEVSVWGIPGNNTAGASKAVRVLLLPPVTASLTGHGTCKSQMMLLRRPAECSVPATKATMGRNLEIPSKEGELKEQSCSAWSREGMLSKNITFSVSRQLFLACQSLLHKAKHILLQRTRSLAP